MSPLTRLLFLQLVFDNFFRFVLIAQFVVVVIGLLAVSILLGVIVIQGGIVILESNHS